MSTLGDNVEAAKTRKRIKTNAELAALVEMREGDLSRLLRNDDPNPELKTLLRLAKALDTSVESLIEGVDPEYAAKLRRDFSWDRLRELVSRMNDDQRRHLVTLLHAMLATENAETAVQ